MKLVFGEKKIAITAGIGDDEHGRVKFQKLLNAGIFSESNVYDVPVILEFKNIEGLDKVIEALQHTRNLMESK